MDNNIFSDKINFLLEIAAEKHATDLHLCVGSPPLLRINAVLKPVPNTEKLSPEDMERIVWSYLDEEKAHTLRTNKALDFSYSKKGLGRYRCNIYLQRGTYAIAVRTLPLEIPAFDTLGLPEVIKTFIDKPKGLVLITGATGSGKSTTLASLIDMVNQKYNYHIITIEDPLEYLHRHKESLVTQREVGSDALSFASALRSSLREDPDVIMLGEMRDTETISIALSAAETGHLVFSTLHTIGAVKAVDRIIDAFPDSHQNQIRSQLCTVLEGIVSQELLPMSNGRGMIPACDVMLVNPAVRNLIREGKQYQINNLIQSGGTEGMFSLERDLARLYHDGIIDQTTALVNAQDTVLLNQYIFMKNA
ncbi:MAG: type IV pilus twitching motility protein PilT [Clostridia bacterium]